jgi:hypothetical protein
MSVLKRGPLTLADLRLDDLGRDLGLLHPIASAPRDGSVIELSSDGGKRREMATWAPPCWRCIQTGELYEETDYWPTHWRYVSSSEPSGVLQ